MKRLNRQNRAETGNIDNERPISVALVLSPLVHAGALFGAYDIFSSAGLAFERSGGIEGRRNLVRPLIAAPQEKTVTGWNGVPLKADALLKDIESPDVVFLPSHGDPLTPPPATPPQLLEFLRRQYEKGAIIASACSGSLLLAEAGLLDGQEATTHWAYTDVFRKHYPRARICPEKSLVLSGDGGRIVTAGGGALWHDLVLYLISRLCGREAASHLAKLYLIDWHSEGQLPYACFQERLQHQDRAVRDAQEVMTRRFADPDVIAHARDAACLSERTLERRFRSAVGVSPSRYVQELRVEAAKEMIEREASSIDDIASRVGYADPASFRRVFTRLVGLSPGSYRKRFGQARATVA